MTVNGRAPVPAPVNEPVFDYAPQSPERAEIKSRLERMVTERIEIPLIIGGEEVWTGDTSEALCPHAHGQVLATWHRAGPADVRKAIDSATAAQKEWSSWPQESRAAVFLRAAERLATTERQTLNAATILGQSKTVHQAEVDAVCELADFWRFNAHFAAGIIEEQPFSGAGVWNRTDHRPLEGFVYAVSPFNFTAIGGNLAGAPAIMGNTVVWKPSSNAVLSSYYVAKLLIDAGLPPGVINFLPGNPVAITEVVLSDPALAGIHYTGSTEVFQSLWRTVGDHIAGYRSYPRLVGETGGKDFIVAHPSADPDSLVTAIVRGAFEYQGQKCSAASRVYIPESLWEQISGPLIEQTEGLTMGDPSDFGNFVSAVISESAFTSIRGYIDRAKESSDADILAGGETDDTEGWFIRPTIIRAHRPDYESMTEEIFGPVVTVYVYADGDWSTTLQLIDATSPYALTGAVFSRDRGAILEALKTLRFAAGNFYVNDKPTGAVVGQQPFGGARASGTNDKAGSPLNLQRWVSPRTLKETLAPPTDYRYPSLE